MPMPAVLGSWRILQSGQLWKHHEAESMTASSTPVMLCRELVGDLGKTKIGELFGVTLEPAKQEEALAISPVT